MYSKMENGLFRNKKVKAIVSVIIILIIVAMVAGTVTMAFV